MNEQTNQQTDFANQWITKQAAIDALYSVDEYNALSVKAIKDLPSAQPETCAYWDSESNFCALYRPSAQPYTDAEIQKMQDLEQAQFDKMYQLGYEEGKQAAQAQGMKSRWFDGRCLRCGEHAPFHPMASTYYESNFCPNCGAYMQRGEKDE